MINGITNQRRVAKLCKLLNPLAHKVSPHNNCVTNVSPLNPCESSPRGILSYRGITFTREFSSRSVVPLELAVWLYFFTLFTRDPFDENYSKVNSLSTASWEGWIVGRINRD